MFMIILFKPKMGQSKSQEVTSDCALEKVPPFLSEIFLLSPARVIFASVFFSQLLDCKGLYFINSDLCRIPKSLCKKLRCTLYSFEANVSWFCQQRFVVRKCFDFYKNIYHIQISIPKSYMADFDDPGPCRYKTVKCCQTKELGKRNVGESLGGKL